MNYLFLFSGIGIGFLLATILFYIIVVKMVWTAKTAAENKGDEFNKKLLQLWEERNAHSMIISNWCQENWSLSNLFHK